MARIKVFIVTYNRPELLDRLLCSIENSDLADNGGEVYIINNYGKLRLPKFKSVKILDNVCQPDFADGHLARNWNQALILGFKNLITPDADIVVCLQDDTVVQPNFTSTLIEQHKRFAFISAGAGDELHSYTRQAVVHIGLWDERFNSIYHQEGDYFLRAMRQNKRGIIEVSINDNQHKRLWNELSVNPLMPTVCAHVRGDQRIEAHSSIHAYNQSLIIKKWGAIVEKKYLIKWEAGSSDWWDSLPDMQIEDFPLYPYFMGIPAVMTYLISREFK